MEKIKEMIEEMGLEKQITLEDIPEIDLYMDQVIQLFENKFSASKRNEEEKVLTKTMINNYAKGKLFFPIKNKKYSKEHLILISLIYQLKGGLSIHDIKEILSGINDGIINGNFDLENFYKSYLHLFETNVNLFKEGVISRIHDVSKEVEKLDMDNNDYLKRVLMIASLVNMSNFYRRAAEKFVDEIMEDN